MVKSHVECSSELVWQCVKKNNAYVRASVNRTRFSAERGNVTSKHGFSSSGIANNNTIDIQELAGTKTPSSTLNGANNKGIFRNQAKAVDASCATRPDLRKKALARVSAIHKAGRVARAKK